MGASWHLVKRVSLWLFVRWLVVSNCVKCREMEHLRVKQVEQLIRDASDTFFLRFYQRVCPLVGLSNTRSESFILYNYNKKKGPHMYVIFVPS